MNPIKNKKIEKISTPFSRKEGELTEEDILVQYIAGDSVHAANFSPDGEKIVIGSNDRMMRVFG